MVAWLTGIDDPGSYIKLLGWPCPIDGLDSDLCLEGWPHFHCSTFTGCPPSKATVEPYPVMVTPRLSQVTKSVLFFGTINPPRLTTWLIHGTNSHGWFSCNLSMKIHVEWVEWWESICQDRPCLRIMLDSDETRSEESLLFLAIFAYQTGRCSGIQRQPHQVRIVTGDPQVGDATTNKWWC